jgi:site-specific DNA recombinase
MTTATADLYLRLSLDHPGATAIERQEAECRRWCLANGLSVSRVHVDRGVSGYSEREQAHRDGFTAALNSVASGQTSTLVVWKLDRLSRRGIGQVGLDTAQPQARVIIALLSEFARAESESMGVRIKSVKEAQRARGEWLSGKPPYGYEIAEDRRLRPVEPAASMMRKVFEMIIAGHTLYAICAMLNDAGLRNARGSQFTTTVLSVAIRTPAYAGLTPARHVNATGQHAAGSPGVYRDRDTGEPVCCLTAGAEPIISRATQLQALNTLETRLRRYGRGIVPRRPAYALLLQGLGRCASCHRPVITNNGYRCFPLDKNGQLACRQPVRAMVDPVDRRVTGAWINLVCTGGPEAEPLRRAIAERWTPIHTPPHWAQLNTELHELTARLDDVDDAYYVRGDLDARRHAHITNKLTRKIAQTEDAILAAEPVIDTTALRDRDYITQRWAEHAPDGRRALLRLAWSQIHLHKAKQPGGPFGENRISYHPNAHPTPDDGKRHTGLPSSAPPARLPDASGQRRPNGPALPGLGPDPATERSQKL